MEGRAFEPVYLVPRTDNPNNMREGKLAQLEKRMKFLEGRVAPETWNSYGREVIVTYQNGATCIMPRSADERLKLEFKEKPRVFDCDKESITFSYDSKACYTAYFRRNEELISGK